jgi:hypothetical protein
MPQRNLTVRPGGDQLIVAPPILPPPPPPPPPPPSGSFRTFMNASELDQALWGQYIVPDGLLTDTNGRHWTDTGGFIDVARAAPSGGRTKVPACRLIMKVTPGNNSRDSNGNYRIRIQDGTNPDGTPRMVFWPTGWKTQFDNWYNDLSVAAIAKLRLAVQDGVIICLYALDDFAGTLGGNAFDRAVVYEELEEISRHVKVTRGLNWLPIAVRGKNSYLKATATTTINGRTVVRQYRYLDAGWNQYRFDNQGPLNTYVSAQIAAGLACGLGSIAGLNVLNGGLGSTAGWGTQHPDSASLCGMSPDEVLAACRAFLDYQHSSGVRYAGLNHWSYGISQDAKDYFNLVAMQTALTTVWNEFKDRVDGPLNVRGDLIAA